MIDVTFDNSKYKNNGISSKKQKILLDSFFILSQNDSVFDRPIFKKMKKQALCSVLYELSTNKIQIPSSEFDKHQSNDNSNDTAYSQENYKAIISFFVAQNIVSNTLLLLGSVLSISSYFLLTYFSDFQKNSTFIISISFLLIFYFMKKQLELSIYERFVNYLNKISK